MNSSAEVAVQRFAEGFSCSQAVFSAFAPSLALPESTAMKIASAFGGGVARRGEVCGAVTGALMALGLARGHAETDEAGKTATYELVNEFVRRFEAAHQAIGCRHLIGHAIDTPVGLQGARDAGVFKTICPGLVADATLIAAALLERSNPDVASQ